jgi:hypothetical protein
MVSKAPRQPANDQRRNAADDQQKDRADAGRDQRRLTHLRGDVIHVNAGPDAPSPRIEAADIGGLG